MEIGKFNKKKNNEAVVYQSLEYHYLRKSTLLCLNFRNQLRLRIMNPYFNSRINYQSATRKRCPIWMGCAQSLSKKLKQKCKQCRLICLSMSLEGSAKPVSTGAITKHFQYSLQHVSC